MSVVLARVTRSGFAESEHRGSVVTLDADGSPVLALGDVDAPVFPRSSLKPLQVVGMLRSGLSLAAADIAMAAASHSGEGKHVSRVRELLHRARLPESALACPPSLPLSEAAAEAVIRAGGGPSRVQMNCSGKHAAMLLTCLAAGWPTEGYVDPDHPVQKAIHSAVEDLAGETVAAVGIDGCGAAVFAISLHGLARSFARLVRGEPASAERTVADAMRAHPDLVGGEGRDVTRLMAGVPGLLAKDGAEGVYVAAIGSGAATAVKIDDGAARARPPVIVRELRRLGAEGAVLDELAEGVVLGGGRPVGAVRTVY
ncbi:MAG: asparaginase [Pseudonocardiales bacterium]